MLRIIGSTELNVCSVQVADYLPISVRCTQVASPTPLYWRTGDFKKSLLEIGLNQNTGELYRVTVTLIGNYSRGEIEAFAEARTVQGSVPICDISGWPADRFKDEPFTFTTLIGEDSVSIWLGPTASLKTIYEIGHVRFAADGEANLRVLQFTHLSRSDLDRIIKTII